MSAVDGRIGAVLVVDAPFEMTGRVAGRLTALADTHGGTTETVEHPGLAATFGTLPQALSAAAELVLDADSPKLRCGIVAVQCDVELGAVVARARDLCRKTQPGQLIVSVLSTALGEPAEPPLAGRGHEIEVLAGALSDAEAGRPQVFTVVGELGSGRSALLVHVGDLARSRGFAVLTVVGASGALSGRWASLRGAVLWTPEGQHRGSDWLPSLAADDMPDDAPVARELLARLSALTDMQPVLVSIDDVDRIDESSWAALLSLASGLAVERCLIVGSGPHMAAQHLGGAVLPLAPLPDEAVRDLIERDGVIDPAVLRRCVDLAGGNALAAREISRSLSPLQRSGAEPIPRVPAPAAAVLGGFRELLSQSTESARRAAVVAAADDTGDAGVVRAALVELGEDPGGLDAAEAAGLIVLEAAGLRFAHPLLRSVAYHQLAPGSRRAAHKALAVVLDRPHQAAARAYQLAAAAESPNSGASEALALVAETELSRGDVLAAARALGTAARFTGDDALRGQRLARAATLHLRAGDLASVDVLLGDLGYPIAVPDALVARCLIDLVRMGPMRARASLERAAVVPELSADVHALCRYLDAVSGESLAGPGLGGSLAAIARVVAGAGPAADLVGIDFSPGAMGALEASLAAHALSIAGWPAEAQAVLRRLDLDGAAIDAVGMQATAGLLAMDAGRPLAALEVLGDAVAPPAGRSPSDVLRLLALARARVYCGRLDDADLALRDAMAVIDRLGLVVHEPEADLVGGLIMHARGREEGVELLARSALRRPDRALAELVVATLDRRAEPQAGWAAQLRTLLESPDRRVSLSARRALAALRDDAEELTSVAKQYEEAGLELEATLTDGVIVSTALRVAPEEGRRLRASASPGAGSSFTGRGVVYPGSAWWHDAGQQHTVRDKLSPAELRVAVAVGTGATNKEVSAQLFISVKTVDYHLQNIYRKLGARSRTELAVLLAGSASAERGSGE
ncbi:MAG TPA: LuxR family transcriptional regulator [Aeromicrobium sp.]|nr:LuxR family transcriptional regulator [Aeromicrobium sp.]